MSGPKQERPRRARGGFTLALTTVSILALLLLGGTYLRIQTVGQRITDRNLRELARIGRGIEGQLNNLDNVLSNISRSNPDSVPATGEVLSKAALVPGLSNVRVDTVVATEPTGLPRTVLELAPGDELTVRHEFESSVEDSTRVLHAVWSIGGLADDLESDYFAGVLLADGEGHVVLAPPERAGIRIQNLSRLRMESDTTVSDDDRLPTPSASDIQTVAIAGRSYRLFRQPLDLVLVQSADGTSESEQPWILAGFVPEDEFTRDSVALGPGLALSLGLLVVFGVLVSPFVTVASMGPRERLRVRQLLYLIVSLILAGGLAGLRLADLAHYARFRDDLYAGADSVADLLARNVLAEAGAALDELNRQGAALTDSVARARDRETTMGVAWGTAPFRLETSITPFSYPVFQSVFWTDSAGAQAAKWTPRATNTPLVNVSGRDYVRAIRGGRGWPSTLMESSTDAAPSRPDTTYYLESIRSITTGEYLAVFSRPFEWRDWARARRDPLRAESPVPTPGVAAIVTRLVSLESPVLAAGMEFAVVSPEGRTLFHSQRERNLEEDFIGETGEDRRVESILDARVIRSVDARYRERRSRLFFRPLQDTPLSLVLVLDKAPQETARFEAWFIGGALFLGFSLLVFLWLGFVEAIIRTRFHWVWPDLDQPAKHQAVARICGLFALVLLVQAWIASSSPPHLSSFLQPFQALGLGLVILSVPRRPFRRPPRPEGRRSLAGLAAALLSWLPSGPFRSLLKAQALGWALTGLTTLAMILAHVREPQPFLLVAQLAVLALAARITWVTGNRAGTFKPGPALYRYETSLVMGLLVVAILPGYLLYQMVFADHMELVVRHHQTQVAEQLFERDVRLTHHRQFASSPPQDSLSWDWIRCSEIDLAFQPVFRTGAVSRRADRVPCPQALPATDTVASASICVGDVVSGGRDGHYQIHEKIGDRVPWLTEVSVEMRQLLARAQGRCWLRFERGADEPSSDHTGDSLVFEDARFTVSSTFPIGLGAPSWAFFALLLIVMGVFLGVLRWLAQRLFLIELGDPRPLTLREALQGEVRRNVAFVCMRSTSRAPIRKRAEAGELVAIDMMDAPVDERGAPVLEPVTDDVVCIDHFDHRILEPVWSEALVSFLERLMYVQRSRVLLLTSREPDELFPTFREELEGHETLLERWARLLGQFTKVAVADDVSGEELAAELDATREERCRLVATDDPTAYSRCERLDEILVDECGSSVRLHNVALQIASSPVYTGIDPEELYDLILEGATPFYSAVWAVLGEEEQLVVAQLAAGAVVNPRCVRSVRRLFARGIVVRAPELRLLNRTFGSFIREAVPTADVLAWERSGVPSTWSQIRFPLLLVWIALALFLFWTQRSLLGDAAAFLGTAGVGLAAIIRVLTLFEKGPSQQESKG